MGAPVKMRTASPGATGGPPALPACNRPATLNGRAAPLAAVEAEISRRLAGAAVELADRALLPHLTLGRVKMAGAGIDWPKILQSAEVKNATSVIDRVTLYQSTLSQYGPHYTELVNAPLIGNDE